MRAKDVMTTHVITVAPDTPVREVATLLAERAISGVPVVDGTGRVVGIVSEGDLMHRTETGTERHPTHRRSWWLDGLAAERDLARDYIKSHGRTAKDIMTREVISVTEDTDLGDVATLLETHRIKRVPVMQDGRLVGIISRANLVRALAAAPIPTSTAASVDDRSIRTSLLAELKDKEWAHVWPADIIVRDGVVHFWFTDDQPEEQRAAMRIAAENTPGVRGVEQRLVPAPVIPAF
jgi:CBS domain-containing protein